MSDSPLILWFRRDLRLADHPMLEYALATGRPIVPLFILDPETDALGAASKWRLGLGLAQFSETLKAVGSRLILRRGNALSVLQALIAETGAKSVHWSRQYDAAAKARDTGVKAALRAHGLEAKSHPGHLLFEPWTVETGQGGFYRVYTPFWRSVKDRHVAEPSPAPKKMTPAVEWPKSERLQDWHMGAAMQRGAEIVGKHVAVGETAANERLWTFLDGPVANYAEMRNMPAIKGTSRLSENLAYGEIGPRTIWHAASRAFHEGKPGAETFLKEIVWREFAYHLLHHTPHIATRNWREEWDGFGWQGDNRDAERWRRGMTGEPFVDAAMREMYVTGTMQNRGRMIVASYLTKHLLTDWRVGLRWFEDCLIDWDPAANAMGWQWAAGSGPDAAPYFRIFNPDSQLEKFDPKSDYRERFIAELSKFPGRDALDFFHAVPKSWGLDPATPYPDRIVELAEGRERALQAYAARNAKSAR